MNKSFQEVVGFYKPVAKLTHKQEVQRLYRGCLRCLVSWTESRDVFNEEATKIREEFNLHMKADTPQATRLLREGKERLVKQTHPDPYIAAYMPGGSLFMRNPALPLELMYPDGVPSHYSKRRLNIDMSNIPEDQPFANKVFVDSISKRYWIDK